MRCVGGLSGGGDGGAGRRRARGGWEQEGEVTLAGKTGGIMDRQRQRPEGHTQSRARREEGRSRFGPTHGDRECWRRRGGTGGEEVGDGRCGGGRALIY